MSLLSRIQSARASDLPDASFAGRRCSGSFTSDCVGELAHRVRLPSGEVRAACDRCVAAAERLGLHVEDLRPVWMRDLDGKDMTDWGRAA